MKKINVFVMCVALGLGAFACSSDDDDSVATDTTTTDGNGTVTDTTDPTGDTGNGTEPGGDTGTDAATGECKPEDEGAKCGPTTACPCTAQYCAGSLFSDTEGNWSEGIIGSWCLSPCDETAADPAAACAAVGADYQCMGFSDTEAACTLIGNAATNAGQEFQIKFIDSMPADATSQAAAMTGNLPNLTVKMGPTVKFSQAMGIWMPADPATDSPALNILMAIGMQGLSTAYIVQAITGPTSFKDGAVLKAPTADTAQADIDAMNGIFQAVLLKQTATSYTYEGINVGTDDTWTLTKVYPAAKTVKASEGFTTGTLNVTLAGIRAELDMSEK